MNCCVLVTLKRATWSLPRQGGAEPITATFRWKSGYTLNTLPVHHTADSKLPSSSFWTKNNLELFHRRYLPLCCWTHSVWKCFSHASKYLNLSDYRVKLWLKCWRLVDNRFFLLGCKVPVPPLYGSATVQRGCSHRHHHCQRRAVCRYTHRCAVNNTIGHYTYLIIC